MKLLKIFCLVLLFNLLVLFLGHLPKGLALIAPSNTVISSQGPAPGSGDIYPNGPSYTPWFAVGLGAYNGPTTYAKVYVTQNSTLTITQASCSTDVGAPDVQYQVAALGADEKTVGASDIPVEKGASQCGGSFTMPINAGQAVNSGIQGHEQWKVFYVSAFIFYNSGDNERSFRFSVNNGGFVGVTRPVYCTIQQGNCDPNDPRSYFGVYARNLGGGNWNYEFQFAPRCNEALSPVTKQIQLYDMDPNVYPQPNLAVDIRKDNRFNNTTFNWSSLSAYPDTSFASGSGNFDFESFTASYLNRYQFWVQDVDWHNTLQIYTPFDQIDATQTVTSKCSPPYNAVCTANGVTNFVRNNMTAGQSIQVNYVFTNKGTQTWTPTDNPLTQYRRTVNGSSFSPITVPNNVPPGNSFTISITETAPNIGSKNISYTMWQSGVGAFGGGCSASLNVGNPPPTGPNSIATSCINTAVQFTTTAIENYPSKQVAFNPPYWTGETPQGGNPDGTFWYDHKPANANIPVPVGSANTTLYLGVLYYKASYQLNSTPASKPAKDVPFYVVWKDAAGNQVGSPTVGVATPTNSSGSVVYSWDNTFAAFPFLLPQNSYTAEVYAVISGTFTQGDPSTYSYSTSPLGTTSLPQCWHAETNPPNNVCVGGSANPAVVAPGSNVDVTYVIRIDNLANQSFSSGYQLVAHPDGLGLKSTGNDAQGITINPGNPTTSAKFTFTAYYTGSYWVELTYNGTRIADLPDQGWDGTCGGNSITPQVTPYFQVWNGDAAAGGGFKTVANQCSSSYPDYVSPVTASSKPNSETYGGIRAISGSTYKSQADFGAIALGIIPSANGGFMAKKAYFSNNKNSVAGTSINGGYLDSNSAGHCVPDYYTKTRFADEANTPGLPGGDLNQAINACTPDAVTQYRRCQYQASGAYLSGPAITIPQGVQLTLYVDGDVTIDTDIRYAEPFDLSSRANIPYLTIIAKGNIFITSNVTRLDGLYVAQPSSSGNDGDFNTCSDDSCPRQLVINGAVIARHVKLMRSHGASQSLNNDINGIGNTPAEIINFTPAMILGAPAFSPASTSPEGLFSLPPVF